MAVVQVNSRDLSLIRLETSGRIENLESRLNFLEVGSKSKSNQFDELRNEIRTLGANVSNVISSVLFEVYAIRNALSITFPGIEVTIDAQLGIPSNSEPFDLVNYVGSLINKQLSDSDILSQIDDAFKTQTIYNSQFANSINRLSTTAFQNVYLQLTAPSLTTISNKNDAYISDLLTALDVSVPRSAPAVQLYSDRSYPFKPSNGYFYISDFSYFGTSSPVGPFNNTNIVLARNNQMASCVDSSFGRESYTKTVVYPTNSPTDISLLLATSMDNVNFSNISPSSMACTGYTYTINVDLSMSISVTYSLGLSFQYSGALQRYMTTNGIDGVFSVTVNGQYNGFDYTANVGGSYIRRRGVLKTGGFSGAYMDYSSGYFTVPRVANASAKLVNVDYNYTKGIGIQYDFVLPANNILTMSDFTSTDYPNQTYSMLLSVGENSGKTQTDRWNNQLIQNGSAPFTFGYTSTTTPQNRQLYTPFLIPALFVTGIDLWMVDANNSPLVNIILGNSNLVNSYVGTQFRSSFRLLTLQPPTNVTQVTQISSSQYILQTVQIISLTQAFSILQSQLVIIQTQVAQLSYEINQIQSALQAQAAASTSPWAIFTDIASVFLGIGGVFSYASTFVKLFSTNSIKLFRSLGTAFSVLGSIAITTAQVTQSIVSGNGDIAGILSQSIAGIGQILELRAILKSLPKVQVSLDGVLSDTLVKDIRKINDDFMNNTSKKTTVSLRNRLIDTDDLLIKSGVNPDDSLIGSTRFPDDESTALLSARSSKTIKQDFVDYIIQDADIPSVRRKYLDPFSVTGEPTLVDGDFTSIRGRQVTTIDVQSSPAYKQVLKNYGVVSDAKPSTFTYVFTEGKINGNWVLLPDVSTAGTIRTDVGFYRNTVLDSDIRTIISKPAAVTPQMMTGMLLKYDEVVTQGSVVKSANATTDLFNFAQTGTPMLSLNAQQRYSYLRELALKFSSAVNKNIDLPMSI